MGPSGSPRWVPGTMTVYRCSMSSRSCPTAGSSSRAIASTTSCTSRLSGSFKVTSTRPWRGSPARLRPISDRSSAWQLRLRSLSLASRFSIRETASQDLLDSLQFVALQVVVVQPLDDGAGVCPKSSAGWNDCFFASEAYTDAPLVLDAYVGEDGVLEFWQLDESEDLRSPVDLAGTIEIPEAMRGSEDLAASVVFDAHGSPMVRDSAWIRLADLTNEFLDSDAPTSGFRPVELPSDSE